MRPRRSRGLFDEDATLCERTSLRGARGTISLESYDFPGRFVRYRSHEVWLDVPDGSRLFAADATFVLRPA